MRPSLLLLVALPACWPVLPGPYSTDADTGPGDSGSSSNAGLTVFDVQDGTVAVGTVVTLRGVVVTGTKGTSGVFVEDPAGGARSGVFVYMGSGGAGTQAGSVVDVTGVVVEWDDHAQWTDTETQIDVTQGGSIQVRRQGTVPAPVVLPAATFLSNADVEPYEGVGVRVRSVTVTSSTDALGNATFSDGVRASRAAWPFGGLARGDVYEVTGPLGYGSPGFFILPQGPEDLVWENSP